MKSIISIFLLCLITTFAFAQDGAFKVISQSEEHSIFTELLELTGTDALLEDDNYYSIFVPDNDAFLAIYSVEQLDSLKLNELETLTDILLQHIIPDTVFVGNFTGPYLPLHGNFINLFIDAAANILVDGGGSRNPQPRLKYPATSQEIFQDVYNGRILWMENNFISLECQPLSEALFYIGNVMFMAMSNTGIYDTLNQLEGPLTIIASDDQDTYAYINDNGGFMNNNSFLDSFVRRHIIDGSYPFQKIDNGLTVQNWLGETVEFSKNEEQYFVNGLNVLSFRDFKNVIVHRLGSYLLEPIISSVEQPEFVDFKIYPNPASQYTELRMSKGSQNCDMKIFTLGGKEVLHNEITEQATKLDVSELIDGVYIVQIRNDSFFKVVKLVISH